MKLSLICSLGLLLAAHATFIPRAADFLTSFEARGRYEDNIDRVTKRRLSGLRGRNVDEHADEDVDRDEPEDVEDGIVIGEGW
ncbi:hypothetical protein BDW68DRAFT_183057 [Aspergillus falconensis]